MFRQKIDDLKIRQREFRPGPIVNRVAIRCMCIVHFSPFHRAAPGLEESPCAILTSPLRHAWLLPYLGGVYGQQQLQHAEQLEPQ